MPGISKVKADKTSFILQTTFQFFLRQVYTGCKIGRDIFTSLLAPTNFSLMG
jgi:hypothetical protein